MTDSTSSPTSFHLNDPNARGFDAEKSGVLSDRGLILDNGETDKQINRLEHNKEASLSTLNSASESASRRMDSRESMEPTRNPQLPRAGSNAFNVASITAFLTSITFETIRNDTDASFLDTLTEGRLSTETFLIDNVKAELTKALRDKEIDLAVFQAYAEAITVAVVAGSSIRSGMRVGKQARSDSAKVPLEGTPAPKIAPKTQNSMKPGKAPSSAESEIDGDIVLKTADHSKKTAGFTDESSLPATRTSSNKEAGAAGKDGGGGKGTVTKEKADAAPKETVTSEKKVSKEEKDLKKSEENLRSETLTAEATALRLAMDAIQGVNGALIGIVQGKKEWDEANLRRTLAEFEALSKLLAGNSDDVLSLVEEADTMVDRAIDRIKNIHKEDQTAVSETFKQVVF